MTLAVETEAPRSPDERIHDAPSATTSSVAVVTSAAGGSVDDLLTDVEDGLDATEIQTEIDEELEMSVMEMELGGDMVGDFGEAGDVSHCKPSLLLLPIVLPLLLLPSPLLPSLILSLSSLLSFPVLYCLSRHYSISHS